MRSAAEGCRALLAELRGEGGLVTGALLSSEPVVSDAGPGPAQLAAAGPRAAGFEHEYELLLEMIYEGTRLHYGTPRVFDDSDSDLCLLLGDRLYAIGLARLATLGDLQAVAELADLISLLAQAQARAQPELAEAIWAAGATAIGWGSSREHAAAKDLARRERSAARASLDKIAQRRGS